MTRVKGGTVHKDHRAKVLKQAKGYFGSKHRLYRSAQEQLMHSGNYAFRDRRQNKREFRKLWITRINAACRLNDISYSKFISGLEKAEVAINRKMLSEIAIDNPSTFTELVKVAKEALEGKKESKKVKQVQVVRKVKAVKKISKVEKINIKEQRAKDAKKAVAKVSTKKEATLDKKTVAELRVMAKEKGIEGYTSLKKAELIAKLK